MTILLYPTVYAFQRHTDSKYRLGGRRNPNTGGMDITGNVGVRRLAPAYGDCASSAARIPRASACGLPLPQ